MILIHLSFLLNLTKQINPLKFARLRKMSLSSKLLDSLGDINELLICLFFVFLLFS